MEIGSSTIHCFRGDDRQANGRPIGLAEERIHPGPIDALYCKACGRAVTSRDQRIEVQGSHAHTFFNPAGIIYELGCFRAAPGCHRAGQATADFTWFAGYVWRFAMCSRCHCHLGWYYQTGDHSFFGLILANLRD